MMIEELNLDQGTDSFCKKPWAREKYLFGLQTKTVKVCHLFWSFNQKNYCLIKENSSWNKMWCFFYELEIKHQSWWYKTITSPRPPNCQIHKWRQCWFVSWLQLVWIIPCASAMRCKYKDSEALMSIGEIQSQKPSQHMNPSALKSLYVFRAALPPC